MRKTALAAAFFFVQLLFSCELFGGRGGSSCPDVLPYFSIGGLNPYHLWVNGTGQLLPKGTPVSWNQYYMNVAFQVTYQAGTHRSGSGAAYALDCNVSGDLGSRIGVDTLYVIALADYNANYAAGDTLNDIVTLNTQAYFAQDFDKFYPVSRYVAENRDGIRQQSFKWRLTEPPAANDASHRFRVVYRLRNGQTFQTDAEPVRLTR